jgi:nitrite reductase (NADH) small subunit
MNAYRWFRLTRCDNIPPREGREVVLGARHIAVFNLGDRFFATDNRCPHQGGPLCDGIVTAGAVVCPLHAWKVDLATGTVERPKTAGTCVRTYPIRVEEGLILLGLEAAELSANTSLCSTTSAVNPSQRPL